MNYAIFRGNSNFGTSLLLANIGPNSPMTPKIVNGSYAALFENSDDVISDFTKKINVMKKEFEVAHDWVMKSPTESTSDGSRTSVVAQRPVSVWGPRIPPITIGSKVHRRPAGKTLGLKQFSLDSRMETERQELKSQMEAVLSEDEDEGVDRAQKMIQLISLIEEQDDSTSDASKAYFKDLKHLVKGLK